MCMDLWWIFLLFAFLLSGIDWLFGLAYVFTGLAFLSAIVGLASAAGLNIFEYDAPAGLLVSIIFTPIFIRLFFVLRSQSSSNGSLGDGSQIREGGRDQRASHVYKGVLIFGAFVPLFTFHFITAGLSLATVAVLAGWVDPARLLPLVTVGFPYIANHVAAAHGVTGTRNIVFATAAGLFTAAAYWSLVSFLVILLHT